ncbi:MAG: caspase family protein [Spirochaetota bacterium]
MSRRIGRTHRIGSRRLKAPPNSTTLATGRARTRRAARLAAVGSLVCAAFFGCGAFESLPTGYAVVYGVSDYEVINDLAQPDDDAEAIAQMLQSQGYHLVSDGPRINEAATGANLEADFAELREIAEPDSRFFFYFAGHGYGDGMEREYEGNPPLQELIEANAEQYGDSEPIGSGGMPEFIFLHHADPYGDPIGSENDIVSDDRLAKLLSTVRSEQRVVVLDSCHSGGFLGSGTSVDALPQGYAGDSGGVSAPDIVNAVTLYFDPDTESDVTERLAIVISAAGEQDLSYEGSEFGLPNGAFTHFFLQAPEHADRNRDGWVTTTEAYLHAAHGVAAAANPDLASRYGDEYQFMPRISGGAVDFVLFRAR